MKADILEQLANGNWGSKARYLVLNRVIRFIAVCLILILLFWLVLIEDYTSLFFLLGAVSGFFVFLTSRFLQNNFANKRTKEGPPESKEITKLTSLEDTRRKSVVGDRD